MFLVELDRFLDCLFPNHVAVGEVLSNDTRARLIFLVDLVAPACVSRAVSRCDLVKASDARDLDRVGSELGWELLAVVLSAWRSCVKLTIVKEKRSLGGA